MVAMGDRLSGGETALPVCLFSENSNRLVSLLDIVKTFHAATFGMHIEQLANIEGAAGERVNTGNGGAVDEDLAGTLKRRAEDINNFCESVGFSDTALSAAFLCNGTGKPDPLNVSHVQSEASHLRESLLREAFFRKFVLIESNKASYVDNEKLLGEAVYEAFSSARFDIKEAGNCFAVECWTAAVFHLMRVAEHGLRALARDRRIRLPKKAEITLATWEDLIRQLEDAESAIQKYPKTLAREAQLRFYHGVMMELRALKNKFRNPAMHTRGAYDVHDASSALGHVSKLMQTLSRRISEKKRTPVVWKGETWTKMEA
jgi:CYTH domain-containing protein